MNTLTATPSAVSHKAAPGLIDARLTAIEPVAKDTNLYTFQRADGGRLPPFKAGAHIDLHLPNGLIRQFSLTIPDTDPNPQSYVVGVKKDANSRGGSRYIVEQMKVGDEIKISAPRNNFPLADDAETIVLVAGGIGITPIWCMAQELAAQKRPWKLYYSCRTRDEMAFLGTLQKFAPDLVHLHFDDEAGGKFLDLPAVFNAAPANAHLYCCGPKEMLAAFEKAGA
jgi:ferredoxin-NADP reductase